MEQETGQFILNATTIVFVFFLAGFASAIFLIILLLKIWGMTNDIKRIRLVLEDMHFRDLARYQSEKRSGSIDSTDMDSADKLLADLKFE